MTTQPWTRADLPIEVRFGMRPPYFLAALLALLALGALQIDSSDPYEIVPWVLLAAIWTAFLLVWLIPVVRDTGGGVMRIGATGIDIAGRRRLTTIVLSQCRDFVLSKTRNRISCVTWGSEATSVRHFDHLRLSRQELLQLTGLLNELAVAARGEPQESAVDATPSRATSREPVPAHLKGPRLGPTGLLRYAGRTVHIFWGAVVLCVVVFVPLAVTSVQCPQPASETCKAVAPVVALAFLLMIPAVSLTVYLLRRYRATAHRLRDLDELPTRAAVWRAMVPFTAERNRLVTEYGTPGPNRFGPPTE